MCMGHIVQRKQKKIIQNFKIDILLSDIEMPEENGLELFAWTRGRDMISTVFSDFTCRL